MQQAQTRETLSQTVPLPSLKEIEFLWADKTHNGQQVGERQKTFYLQLYHTLLTENPTEKNQACENLKLLHAQLHGVYAHISTRITKEGFFELLNRYPPKIIVETLRTQNTQWIAEKVTALL